MKNTTKKIYIFISLPLTISYTLCVGLLFLSGYAIGEVLKRDDSQSIQVASKPDNRKVDFNTKQIALASNLPTTGNKETKLFKNRIYGYSFSYPPNTAVNYNSSLICNNEFCASDDDLDQIQLDELYISTYKPDQSYHLDFDKGFPQKNYKTPKQITIDDQKYYYIISKDGFIELITSEFIVLNDIIWIKEDNFVNKDNSSYYISFHNNGTEKSLPEHKITTLNQILKTFKF